MPAMRDAQSALADLDGILQGLPAIAKSAFLMRYVQHMSVPEIAKALHLSVRAVRKHIDQGLRASYASASGRD